MDEQLAKIIAEKNAKFQRDLAANQLTLLLGRLPLDTTNSSLYQEFQVNPASDLKTILSKICESYGLKVENTRLWRNTTKPELLDLNKAPNDLNLKNRDEVLIDTKKEDGKWHLATADENKNVALSFLLSGLRSKGVIGGAPSTPVIQPTHQQNFGYQEHSYGGFGGQGGFGGGYGGFGGQGGYGDFGGGFGFGSINNNQDREIQEAMRISKLQAEKDRNKYEALENALVGRGLKLRIVSDDGNCLFRAVSYLVNGKDSEHAEVRANVISYMTANREHFEPFVSGYDFDSYLMTMSCDGEYGTNLEVQALSEVYLRPVEVYHDEGGSDQPMNIFQGDNYNPLPIRLSYHRGNHYNAVEPINSEEFVIPPTGFGFGKN